MNEPNTPQQPDPAQVLAQLSAMLAGQRPTAPAVTFQPQPFAPPAGPSVAGILVPVEFAPGLRGYVLVTDAQNPPATIAALQAQGWPIHQYQPRQFGGGSGGYQGGNFQRPQWSQARRW